MAIYLIGDLQGCDSALGRLLDTVAFSPSRDTLYLLGDLVNRGPESLAVLRRLVALDGAAHCLLGNHDLHLLAVDAGVRGPGKRDTLDELLAAPDRPALLAWLRSRSMALRLRHGAQDLLMVHAGVLPQWDADTVMALAGELEAVLRGADLHTFLPAMYGNEPRAWNKGLAGADRLRVVVNALTRLRFCTPAGEMEFKANGGADSAPPGYLPWFDVPGRRTEAVTLAFGHWSALGWQERPNLLGLDTGCVWGGCLTAVRLGATCSGNERIQVHCEQTLAPGAGD